MPLDKEVASNNFRPLFLQPTTSHRNSARLSTLFPRARLRRTSIASDLTLPAPRATHSLRHPCKRLVLENRPADRRNGNQANVCAMAESVHHPTNTYWERRGEWESCRMCAGLQKVTTGRAQPKLAGPRKSPDPIIKQPNLGFRTFAHDCRIWAVF